MSDIKPIEPTQLEIGDSTTSQEHSTNDTINTPIKSEEDKVIGQIKESSKVYNKSSEIFACENVHGETEEQEQQHFPLKDIDPLNITGNDQIIESEQSADISNQEIQIPENDKEGITKVLKVETTVNIEPQQDTETVKDDEIIDNFEDQEKPTEVNSLTSSIKENPRALISFHKIINDKINVTCISSSKENLYIGTTQGDIYHLIRLESEFILIFKTSLSFPDDDDEQTHPITNISILPESNKLLIHSNQTLTFFDTQLHRLKNKQLHNVKDIFLYQSDLTFFQKHIIRNFNSKDLKLKKKIDFGNIIKGVKIDEFAMVLSKTTSSNDETAVTINYDLIDFNTFSKIPILSQPSKSSTLGNIVKLLDYYKLFFITYQLEEIIPMGALVNLNGDIINTITFDTDPVDVFITKDQFIMVSFKGGRINVYYPLADEIRLVKSIVREEEEEEEEEEVRFAEIKDIGNIQLKYNDNNESHQIKQDVVIYTNRYVEVVKLDLFETIVKLNDLSLVEALINHSFIDDEICLNFWNQLKSILLMEKSIISEEVLQELLFFVIGINEKKSMLLIFDLLKERLENLKANSKQNKLFQINLKTYTLSILQNDKNNAVMELKVNFLNLFKDDFKTLKTYLSYLPGNHEDDSTIINWLQTNNQYQLLLLFYKITNQPIKLKQLYKSLLDSGDPYKIDPNFNKHDPQFLSYFQSDLEVLQKINRLNLINTYNFKTDELLKFMKGIKVEENEDQDAFFWELCVKISVKQNRQIRLSGLKKAMLKGELKRLKR